MIDKLVGYYSLMNDDKKTNFIFGQFQSLCRRVIRFFSNYYIPYSFRNPSKKDQNNIFSERREKIIVSLTSFPARINKTWLTIECMLRQTVKPDLIILWLSKEQFPSQKELPTSLLKRVGNRFKIIFVDDDLKSYKKCYYAFQDFPNDIIVTIDDDIFYSSRLIENLYSTHLMNSSAVCCMYAHSIKYTENDELCSYNEWLKNRHTKGNYFFGSGGGTLFPPHVLHPDILRKDLFTSLAPLADDIWLNAMCRLSKAPIIKVSTTNSILPIYHRNRVRLHRINQGQNFNDVQIKAVRDYYLKKLNLDPFSYVSQ